MSTGLRPPRYRVSRTAIWYWTARAAIGWLALAAIQVVWLLLARDGAGWHVAALVATGVLPISRIQTVDSERGPLEQLFGLANVTVTTASAAGPLRIHGLDRDTAQQLVDDLTISAQATRGDAT